MAASPDPSNPTPRLYFHRITEDDYILRENEKICYIETETPLTDEHQDLYNILYQYVQDLVARSEPWMYTPNHDEDTDEIPVPDTYLDYLKKYAHKNNICRHLKGSDYDLTRAKQSFKTVVEWRIQEGIDDRRYEDYRDVLDMALCFCTFERDRAGHPVAYFKFPAQSMTDEEWDCVNKSAIFAAEKAAELSGEVGLFQTTWILDFENIGIRTIPPLDKTRDMIHLWTAYYPERLHRAFVVNAPFAFRALWKIATKFLTENTKGKITMLGSRESKDAQSFAEFLDPDSIHSDYGGNYTETYSYAYEENVRQSLKMAERDMSLVGSDGEDDGKLVEE